jgi:hypothetical protein
MDDDAFIETPNGYIRAYRIVEISKPTERAMFHLWEVVLVIRPCSDRESPQKVLTFDSYVAAKTWISETLEKLTAIES